MVAPSSPILATNSAACANKFSILLTDTITVDRAATTMYAIPVAVKSLF